MPKLSINGKFEKLDKLNKSNPLTYMINASKNKTKLSHFYPMVWILSKKVEGVSLQQFLLSSFYSLESIFLGIVWIDKLHNCAGGIYFNISQGNTKKKLSGTFHGNGC